MPTAQTIKTFYEQATTREFARDFLFRVFSIKILDVEITENELVYAKAAKLPARGITNVQTKYMGLNFNIAGTATYPGSDSYIISFYCDERSELRNKLLDYTIKVFNDENGTGDYKTADTGNVITLLQLDKSLKEINTFTLYGAGVRNVGELSYNMADGTGQPVSFDVTFAYHYFRRGKAGSAPVNPPVRA